jgi:hypothetical protein
MTRNSVPRIITHMTNLAPGWGETGLLIRRFVTSFPLLYTSRPDLLSADPDRHAALIEAPFSLFLP